MHNDVLLHPGESLRVKTGDYWLEIVRDGRGHTGVMDRRGAWLPPVQESADWSFEVQEAHPKNSDHGEQASAMIAEIDGEGDALPGDVGGLLDYLLSLVRVHPLGPTLVILRNAHPHMSLREMTVGLRIQKSAIAQAIQRLVRHDPRLARIVHGSGGNQSQAQRQRRRRERQVNYV